MIYVLCIVRKLLLIHLLGFVEVMYGQSILPNTDISPILKSFEPKNPLSERSEDLPKNQKVNNLMRERKRKREREREKMREEERERERMKERKRERERE